MTSPMGASSSVRESALRGALDRIVADSVPLVSGSLALLLSIFAIVDLFINPPPQALLISIMDVLGALVCAGFFVFAWRRGVPPRYAHTFLLMVGLIPVSDVLVNLYILPEEDHTIYLALAIVGAGSIMLSICYLVAYVATTVAGWALVSYSSPSPPWTTAGLWLVAASLLAFLIHAVRLRTYRRLEELRMEAQRASSERDIREQALESAVQSAWESEQRYRGLVEQAPDAFLVHSKGRILFVNNAAIQLFGAKTSEDLASQNAFDLIHPSYREIARARNTQVEKEARATPMLEMKILRLDGTAIDVETMGQPISYGNDTADQTIIRDITDRKRADQERAVAQARLVEIARLQELDRMKTQFVNTLSHELRTPLTPIKVQLYLLKAANATGDTERITKTTQMLDRNVTRMEDLIDELLEVARLQAGTLKLDTGPLDLDATLSEALESFKDVAQQNGVVVRSTLEHGLHVEADARRMMQIMYNLMNNALKFTPEGGVITIDAHHEDHKAIVKVTDTGIGIREEDIKRLFEPFSQLHDTMQKTNAGTGLGLYICKGIVEGHGGRIWCASPGPGKGTTFAFELPLT